MRPRARYPASDWGGWDGDGYGWYPPAPPKQPPPAHGIRVKKVGTTWWGQRWIAALEKLSWEYANRIARGRTYARAGRVHDLEVARGRVYARVTGSRPTPYTVTIHIRTLSAVAWKKALARMAREAIFAAQLLAGEMPKDIDKAFQPAGVSLFPTRKVDLKTECSCPDWANPCKHVAATHYVLGETFDRDPFLLFELRGRTRDQVLDALRRMRAKAAPDATASEPAESRAPAAPTVSLDRMVGEHFDRLRTSLGGLRFRIDAPVGHAAVLCQLGAPPSWSLKESLPELLGPAYEAAGTWARTLALAGDGSHQEE